MNAQAGSSREPCDEKTTPEHQGAISVLIIDKSQIREDFIGDLVDSVLASRMQQAQQTRPHRCRRLLPRDLGRLGVAEQQLPAGQPIQCKVR